MSFLSYIATIRSYYMCMYAQDIHLIQLTQSQLSSRDIHAELGENHLHYEEGRLVP